MEGLGKVVAIFFLLAVVRPGELQVVVPDCPLLQASDLGGVDAPRTGGLISDTFQTSGDNISPVSLQVLNYTVVCIAQGSARNTARMVSVVARFQLTEDNSIRTLQFHWECNSNGEWRPNVLGSTVFLITDPPDGTLDTPLRQDCFYCYDPDQFASLGITFDNPQHCFVCDPTCNQGLQRCMGAVQTDCCNYFDTSDNCVATCPPNSVSDNTAFTCECIPGYTGVDCTTDIDECVTTSPCRNGGTCNNFDGGFNCSCPATYSGMLCEEDVDECITSSPCQNGGTCNNFDGGFDCSCPSTYSGMLCEEDVDECVTTSPCQNGGTCNNFDGGFDCSCPSTYSGMLCEEDVDECVTSSPCQNGGTCNNTNGSFTCSCPPGYTGETCGEDVDECMSSNPCKGGGTCIDTTGSFMCLCPVGLTGGICEQDVDECSATTNPCANGGTCSDGEGSFTCRCASGFTGDMCNDDIDECSPTNPCMNGGSCNNTRGSFSCTCLPGFTGTLCEGDINECDETPCESGGTCTNTIGSFTCDCTQGITGPSCGEDINECEQVDGLCLNGGTCVNSHGSYTCQCGRNWLGPNCRECVIERCMKCTGVEAVCEMCESGYAASTDGSCIPCSVDFCSECPEKVCSSCVKGYSLDVGKNECIVGDEGGGGGLTDFQIIGIIVGAILVGILLATLVACILLGIYKGIERPRMKKAPKTTVFAKYGGQHNPMYLDTKRVIAVESGEVVTAAVMETEIQELEVDLPAISEQDEEDSYISENYEADEEKEDP